MLRTLGYGNIVKSLQVNSFEKLLGKFAANIG